MINYLGGRMTTQDTHHERRSKGTMLYSMHCKSVDARQGYSSCLLPGGKTTAHINSTG